MTLYGAFRESHQLLPGETVRHVFVNAGMEPDDYPVIPNDGADLLVTFEPWDAERGELIEGNSPACFRQFVARHPGAMVRLAHEMNGDWYPWSGNPERFKRLWRNFFGSLRFGGPEPRNLRRVFAPNIVYPGSDRIASFWPGDDAVDLIGLSGYCWGDGDQGDWRWPNEVFGATLGEVARFGKPVLIAETACPDHPFKAQWIAQLAQLDVAGICWFDADKERNWSIGSPRTAPGKAWRQVVAGGRRR